MRRRWTAELSTLTTLFKDYFCNFPRWRRKELRQPR
jgi:hypothetical protein